MTAVDYVVMGSNFSLGKEACGWQVIKFAYLGLVLCGCGNATEPPVSTQVTTSVTRGRRPPYGIAFQRIFY